MHDLRPLLQPASIALIGASAREKSPGRIVHEKLLASGYAGALYVVDPGRPSILGRPAYPSLSAIGKPIDLVLIATPADAVVGALKAATMAKVAIVMASADGLDDNASRTWLREIQDAAKCADVRVVGPGALGTIRPSAKLDATWCASPARPGRLALLTQSGAVAAAMVDYATPLGLGFSSVVSVGAAVDAGVGELLDLLLGDAETDAILVQVEDIGEARPFLSALRAAARTKPVVVLKTGRALESPATLRHDDVVDAALSRSGAVRVRTSAQLFAAARILAYGRIPQGDRIAIVSNGRGPGVMAADSALDRHLRLARFSEATAAALGALSPRGASSNAIDVHGDSSPATLARAVAIALDDAQVDAVVALHAPLPAAPALDAAREVAAVAAAHPKPVAAAWLGAAQRHDVQDALDAGRVANFHTPETAVEAVSFLVQYRAHQAWLMEVPPPQPEPLAQDLAPLEALRTRLADEGRRELARGEAAQVLAAFGFNVAARREAYASIEIGVARDHRFGPVIFVRPGSLHSPVQRQALMLAPLNARLAADLLVQAASPDAPQPLEAGYRDALIDALTRLSAVACMLPWISSVRLGGGVARAGRFTVTASHFEVDPQCRLMRGYPHMAIHPYPVELIGDVTLRDGARVHVRPIRPEDAPLEQAFVQGLSATTRYFRFFYRLSELTPQMLARFTQVDYDRELALVAMIDVATSATLIGVARYIADADGASAEFAVVVTDAWQRRGVARVLMHGLIVCAKRRGFGRLRGAILRSNEPMLGFVRALGFVVEDDPDDPGQVFATLSFT